MTGSVRAEEVLRLLALIWLGIELCFYFLFKSDWLRLIDVRSSTPLYRLEPEELITRVLDDLASLRDYDVRKFFAGWFKGTALENVKRGEAQCFFPLSSHQSLFTYSFSLLLCGSSRVGNVEEFLAWAMFNAAVEDLNSGQRTSVARMFKEMVRRFPEHANFAPGYNSMVTTSRFTLEPASPHVIFRPLVFYVGIALAKIVAHTVLFQAGFIPYRCGRLSYWFRPSARPKGALEPLPLVFFHGISPGLFVYLPMLRNLLSGRAALLVEMPWVGMGIGCLSPPSREETVRAVKRALRRHGVERACIAGHSYGTFCAAWMVHDAKEIVAQLVLLDPMCMLLALPDITYNFLYRKPSNVMEKVLQLSAASEIGINNTLRRHFWWFNSILFASEIQDIPTVVHLAAEDCISPSACLLEYLRQNFTLNETILKPGQSTEFVSESSKSDGHSSALELIWSEGFSHGEIVLSPTRQREICRKMRLQECRILREEQQKATSEKPPVSSCSNAPASPIGLRVRSCSEPYARPRPGSPPMVRLC